MTPFESLQIEQERIEKQSAIAEALYIDGSTDAGKALPPQSIDEAYLAGYLDTVKKLPRDQENKVQYPERCTGFAFGWVDTPDPTYYNNPNYSDCPF